MSQPLSATVSAPYADTVARTRAALQDEGFGVITEIDMKATLKAKLDVDFHDYIILGACNPKLAHQALQTESSVGLLLPCNVVVEDQGDGTTRVSTVDPEELLELVSNDALCAFAVDVKQRLQRVMAALA